MLLNNNWGSQVFLAFVIAIFLLPFSSAGLVELSINDSDDLLVSEDDIVFQEGTNLNFYVNINSKSDYARMEGDNPANPEKYVTGIMIEVSFSNLEDQRDSLIGYPEYQPLCDTCEATDFDEYLSKFRGNDERFKGYDGIVVFSVTLKNNSGDQVWSDSIRVSLERQSTQTSDSGGFSIPELPPVVEDNLIIIIVGLLVIVLLSVGIYSFVLAPEDTTADLYKPVESIDPLKKSLTGVGHKSELPSESKKLKRLEGTGDDTDDEGEEEDEEDYEDELDDEEDDSDFDERKILDELTGTHSIGSQSDKEEDESDEDGKSIAAAPVKKRAVKKRVAKKGVAKKVVKRPSTKTDTNQPEIKVPKGMVSVKCPSCSKTHNVDENTTKFICSCGRRIRV
tara:strand:+ start:499 stop:1680 length:1182 start_codon:yes stop_codon:yes gene_type:complete